jgi:hypothetical protein
MLCKYWQFKDHIGEYQRGEELFSERGRYYPTLACMLTPAKSLSRHLNELFNSKSRRLHWLNSSILIESRAIGSCVSSAPMLFPEFALKRRKIKFVGEEIVDIMIGPDKRVHEVVKNFVEGIHQLEDLYKKSFTALENLPSELETGVSTGPDELLKHYRHVAEIHIALMNCYHQLLGSYYAFRKCAETHEAVRNEFSKVPGSFSEISSQLKIIIEENGIYLQSLEQLLEESVPVSS